MDVTRLTRVRDVCPFAPTAHHWIFATRWMARVTAGVAPIEYFETGYTVTVLKNRLICWRRTFTTGSGAPSVATSDSLFTIHEWCPSVWPQPRDRRGWRRFGMQHCEAIVFLSEIDRENFARSWSAQARRHLVVFKKTALEKQYREGTIALQDLKTYASACTDFLEHLRPDIMVQRLNAHGPREITVAPDWSINKMATMNAIHDELEKRDTWQGKKLGSRLEDLS